MANAYQEGRELVRPSTSSRILRWRARRASIGWELSGDALRIDLTVPDGSSARLFPPEGWNREIPSPEDFGPGAHRVMLFKTGNNPG